MGFYFYVFSFFFNPVPYLGHHCFRVREAAEQLAFWDAWHCPGRIEYEWSPVHSRPIDRWLEAGLANRDLEIQRRCTRILDLPDGRAHR